MRAADQRRDRDQPAERAGRGHESHAGSSHTSSHGSANGPGCRPGQTGPGNISIYKPVNINTNTNINVYKPVNINTNININKNIDESKNININKNIDNSKNININNNIDSSKNININKNVDINKSIVINKGGSEADAAALAAAIAQSSASASVNVYGSANAAAGSQSYFGGGGAPEAPTVYLGGDIGTIAIHVAVPVVAPRQCDEQDATVIKAIHALCVSADNHEFPASHMVADTWIEAGYEGEVARCIPGSHLKIVIGQVVQSSEGLASGQSRGDVLECAAHEAVRHYKDGMLKCAPAVKVPDCTERTNLRKYGTNDMFFTYRTRLCLDAGGASAQTSSHGGMSREVDVSTEDRRHSDLLRQEFGN